MNKNTESESDAKNKAMKEFIEAKKHSAKNSFLTNDRLKKATNTEHGFSTQKNHHIKHG